MTVAVAVGEGVGVNSGVGINVGSAVDVTVGVGVGGELSRVLLLFTKKIIETLRTRMAIMNNDAMTNDFFIAFSFSSSR